MKCECSCHVTRENSNCTLCIINHKNMRTCETCDYCESPKREYRMITTWNAQLTKHTFLWCGVAIGLLLGHFVWK